MTDGRHLPDGTKIALRDEVGGLHGDILATSEAVNLARTKPSGLRPPDRESLLIQKKRSQRISRGLSPILTDQIDN